MIILMTNANKQSTSNASTIWNCVGPKAVAGCVAEWTLRSHSELHYQNHFLVWPYLNESNNDNADNEVVHVTLSDQ